MVAKTLLLIAGLSLWAQPTTPWIKPQSYTVATLPSPGVTYRLVFVTDASSSSTCSSGGGSNINLCRDTGVAWAIVSSGGGGGSGCVPSGSDNQIITDDGAGGCTSEAQWTIAASILTAGATGGLDAGSATYLKIPTSAGAAPTASGRVAYDSTANKYKFGANTATKTIATEDGNIATATALVANPTNCSGNLPRGIAANGDAEGCADVDLTTEVTGVLPNANTTAASANTVSAIVARDGSGNFAAGTITADAFVTTGSGSAGSIELMQGTAPSAGTTSVKLYAGSAVTSYKMRLPSAAATGFILGTNTAGDVVQTFVASTGSGDVVRATSPTLVTPTLGAATATSINGLTITSSTGTFTVTNGKTVAVQNTLTFSGTDGSTAAFGTGGTVTYTIASGTKALDTDAIASTACDTLSTTTATGVASTDTILITANADITGVTGYTAATTGGLAIYFWPTTNTINWKVCNPTSASITPGAVTLNYRVVR